MTALLDWLDPERQGFWSFDFDLAEWSAVLAGSIIVFALSAKLKSLLWFLDGVDLIIHEAGHPIFGLLGINFVQFLGGTLMQLIMPTAFFVSFLRSGQPKSSDACLFWIGHNFLWIGRYMADARARELPLVGGGEHDWAYLFGALGLLRRDVGIGRITDYLGCLIIALSAYSLYVHSRKPRPDPAL